MRLLRTSVAAGLLLASVTATAEAAPSARVKENGTLVITGTSARDDIALRARSSRLVISTGSRELDFARNAFDRIRVRARRGNDRVKVTFATDVPTLIEGERGNDRLTGGDGAERLAGGRGEDTVVGNGGDDLVRLGAAGDRFRWAPGDGDDVVAGGPGRDDLAFRGSPAAEELSITRDHLRRSVDAVDLRISGLERIAVLARGGADTVTVGDLAGIRRVGADVGAGDGAPDRVTVEGTAGDDTIEATGTAAVFGLEAAVELVGAEPGDRLAIDAGRGADRISSEDLTGLAFSADGGPGTDTILGGRTAETLLGGDEADTVNGRGGDDLVRLGGADDTFAWEPGDGSDTVEGETGRDTMRFAGSGAGEQFEVAPDGNRVRFTRDVGTIAIDLDDVERIDTLALGGADTVTAGDVAGTDLDTLNTDFAADGATDRLVVRGTGGADSITAAGSAGTASVTGLANGLALAVSGAQGPQDGLMLDTLGGDDRVRAVDLAADTLALRADGGADHDTLDGGPGADRLLGGAGTDTVDGNGGDDFAFLGDQDDTFVWDPGDGSDTVEGEAGRDTLAFNGSGADERFTVAPDGPRVRFTRHVGGIEMDLDGVEQLDTAALGGADVLTVGSTAGTALEEVGADLAADGQPDKVNLDTTEEDDIVVVSGAAGAATVVGADPLLRIANANPADDELTVQLLGGDDVLDASGLEADAIALQAQGGPNNDVLVGSDGPDTLFGGANDDVLIGGPGIDTLDGGPGDNTVIQD